MENVVVEDSWQGYAGSVAATWYCHTFAPGSAATRYLICHFKPAAGELPCLNSKLCFAINTKYLLE